MQAEIILYIIIFFYGIVLGSFLNVQIYRLPNKENIVTERSHCMTCKAQLKWYDLVPLFSYLQLRGKCRYCGAKISIQYPLIEGINGCGYVLIFAVNGFSWLSILDCLVFSCLIVISVIDERTQEIPIELNIAILVLGCVRTILDVEYIYSHIGGVFVVCSFMLILLWGGRTWKGIDAFGGGDIKLMAAAGLYTGWRNIILAFFLGCVFGAVIHSMRIRLQKESHVLAFGPYLCAGIFIVMLGGKSIIQWYLNLFM